MNGERLRRLVSGRTTVAGQLRLVPAWAALAGTFTVAVTVLTIAVWAGFALLGVHGFKHEKHLSSATFFDLVKLAFAVVAGIGGVVALVLSYRKQRLTEAAELREVTKLHTDRFTAATAQLGTDSSAVQLAGVHALAGLADDAPTRALRQTCIDVLCAFLRMPYDPDPGDLPADANPVRAQEHHGRVSFQNTTFAGGMVDFGGAEFTGGMVYFRSAGFTGGEIDFVGAAFAGGTVDLVGAVFTGGMVDLVGAKFTGGKISFSGAQGDVIPKGLVRGGSVVEGLPAAWALQSSTSPSS